MNFWAFSAKNSVSCATATAVLLVWAFVKFRPPRSRQPAYSSPVTVRVLSSLQKPAVVSFRPPRLYRLSPWVSGSMRAPTFLPGMFVSLLLLLWSTCAFSGQSVSNFEEWMDCTAANNCRFLSTFLVQIWLGLSRLTKFEGHDSCNAPLLLARMLVWDVSVG